MVIKRYPRSTAITALAFVIVGVAAVIGVGGPVADVVGLVTVAAALATFCVAVFRIAEGAPPAKRSSPRRLR